MINNITSPRLGSGTVPCFVGNPVPQVHVFSRETDLGDGAILVETVRLELRMVPDIHSMGMKVLTKETVTDVARLREMRWGPFTWWDRISNPTGLRCAGLDAHKQHPVVGRFNGDGK